VLSPPGGAVRTRRVAFDNTLTTAATAETRPPMNTDGTTDAPDGGRREQILDAARAALIKVGYEKITTRRIAEEAGVNIATLHYHFGTKEALLAEAVRHTMRRVQERLRRAIEGAPSASDAVERVYAAIWQIMRERPGVLRYDVTVRGFRDPAARDDALEIYDGYRRLMTGIVERHLSEGGRLASGFDSAALTGYMLATLDGIVLQYTLTGNDAAARVSLEVSKRHALDIMGLLPRNRDADAAAAGRPTAG